MGQHNLGVRLGLLQCSLRAGHFARMKALVLRQVVLLARSRMTWTVRDGNDLPKTDRTMWTAGGTAKVAFAALFNHGGGYSYRLCPADSAQTEECFQKTHLEFADDTTTVHWTTGK